MLTARALLPAGVRLKLAHWRFEAPRTSRRLLDATRRVIGEASAVGWWAALRLLLPAARRPATRRPAPLRRVRLRGYRHPIHYRPGTSDRRVAWQVFAQREYACVAGLPDVRFVVDCGANVGFTTFFLLHHYPDARAVVVEPDGGNLRVCRRNLAPFGDRVTFVQAGVWSAVAPLVVERGAYRDGAEWSFQVRPARPGETPDLDATTVPDVLAAAAFPRADVLKMDIEAAEAEVFKPGAGAERWLARVGTLVIELHGPECERAVTGALAGFRFDADRRGELTVFRNLQPR